jgi:ATP-binding cassette subfamily C protein LapB
MTVATFKLPSWLRSSIAGVRPLLRDAFFLSLVLNILAIATPVFVLQVYDRVIFHNGLATLTGLAVGMIIVMACDFLFRIVRARLLQHVALELDTSISSKIFHAFMHAPLKVLENRNGSYWQRVFHDSDTIRAMVSGGTAVILSDIPFIILFLGLIGIVAQPILWVVCGFVLVFCALAVVSNRLNQSALQTERSSRQNRDRLMAELIMGRATVRALGVTDYITPMMETAQAEHIENSLKRGKTNDIITSATHVLTMGSTVAIVSIGALAILSQDLTMGGLIAANMLASRLLQPLHQLIGTWKSLDSFKQAVTRLDSLFAETETVATSTLPPSRIRGAFTLDNVTFGYDANKPPIVRNLGVALRPGGITAIIGPNGSGKTSLLKILMGLYTPDQGRVLLDGGDICQYSHNMLSRWIGYAPQETFLLSGTIRDNIIARHPDADEDSIREASQMAGLDTYVRLLPKGYDTTVGEAGNMISGGVRQRIGLARAMLCKPPILLLDEPTSHLDQMAEAHLGKVLANYAETRTIILVSHSSTLLSVSRDLLMLSLTSPAKFGPAKNVLRPPVSSTAPLGGKQSS